MTQRPAIPYATVVLSGLLALTLSACSGSAQKDEVDAIDDLGLLAEFDGATTGALGDDGGISSEGLQGEFMEVDGGVMLGDDSESGAIAPPGMTVYFDYDSVSLAPEYMEVVDRVAAQLSNKGSLRIRLEGHADERGTRTYNLALGERRAQSVVDMLLERGVLAEQMYWVSYGEEIPAVVGQGESVWAKNRRVEIIVEE